MKINRIYSIVLRHIYAFKRSLGGLSDVFYWPTVDLVLWGLTSTYVRRYVPNNAGFVLMIISGIMLWLFVWRGQYEISVNLLEEVWNKNMINIFAAPLKFSEWIVSLITLGIIKAAVSFSFASLVAFIFYKVNVYHFGFYLLPFAFLLIMTGWWVGFFVAGLILRYGSNVQNFAWSLVFVISPFSAVYYPVSILPKWAQTVAAFVPTSYIFEGARGVINQHAVNWNNMLICLLLNIVYLTLALIFMKKSFDKLMDKGLAKLF